MGGATGVQWKRLSLAGKECRRLFSGLIKGRDGENLTKPKEALWHKPSLILPFFFKHFFLITRVPKIYYPPAQGSQAGALRTWAVRSASHAWEYL